MSEKRQSIPSDDDFDRASQHMTQRSRLESRIRERVLATFSDRTALQDFYIFHARKGFDAYIFVPLDRDLAGPSANILREQVRSTVLSVLEAEGCGSRDAILLRLEMDSHERVQRVFNGNYYKRFR